MTRSPHWPRIHATSSTATTTITTITSLMLLSLSLFTMLFHYRFSTFFFSTVLSPLYSNVLVFHFFLLLCYITPSCFSVITSILLEKHLASRFIVSHLDKSQYIYVYIYLLIIVNLLFNTHYPSALYIILSFSIQFYFEHNGATSYRHHQLHSPLLPPSLLPCSPNSFLLSPLNIHLISSSITLLLHNKLHPISFLCLLLLLLLATLYIQPSFHS